MASKRKDNYPSNDYEYADWLYTSGRLTAEEHLKLKEHLLDLETGIQLTIENSGC